MVEEPGSPVGAGHDRDIHTTAGQMLLQAFIYMQTLAVVNKVFDIRWPAKFVKVMSAAAICNLTLDEIPLLSCLFKGVDYYRSYLLWGFLPLGVLAGAGAVAACLVPPHSTPRKRELFLSGVHRGALVLLFALYVPVTTRVMSIFSCREIDGQRYLRADLTKQCYDFEHLAHLVVGLVFAAVYVVGVPLFYVASFRRLDLWGVLRQKQNSLYLYHACQRYMATQVAGMPDQADMPNFPVKVIARMHADILRTGCALHLFQPSVVPASHKLGLKSREQMVDFQKFWSDGGGEEQRAQATSPRRTNLSCVLHALQQAFDPFKQVLLERQRAVATMSVQGPKAETAGAKSLTVELLEERLVQQAMQSQSIRHTVETSLRWSLHRPRRGSKQSLFQLPEREALLTAGLILMPYTPQMFLFEVAECGRKLFLTSLMVFIFPESKCQTLVALAFNTLALLVYSLLRPASTKLTHSLMVMYTVVLNVNLFVGLNIQCDFFDRDNHLVAAVLVVLNVLCVGAPVLCALLLLCYKCSSAQDADRIMAGSRKQLIQFSQSALHPSRAS